MVELLSSLLYFSTKGYPSFEIGVWGDCGTSNSVILNRFGFCLGFIVVIVLCTGLEILDLAFANLLMESFFFFKNNPLDYYYYYYFARAEEGGRGSHNCNIPVIN